MKQNIFFVSGIDTNIGKTYATGFLAKTWKQQGHSVITQKMIQTGNTGLSEDILKHREIMEMELTAEDREGLTMPELFAYPASPHLAARLEGRDIDFNKIEQSAALLSERYDRVLIEGAGGLMVPLTPDLLTIDYIAEKGFPLIFVTSGRLGSINHTLLSFEAIQKRGIALHTLLFNEYPADGDKAIMQDTLAYLAKELKERFPAASLLRVSVI